ncbi:class I SAM-dependent methyltransferase [Chloroflexota bacterium]
MIKKENRHTRIPQSRAVYKIAAFMLGNPLRRFTMNPIKVLSRMGIQRGLNVLEVGCGPGFFTIPAAKMLEDGNIYALDLSPIMIENVTKRIEKYRIMNVTTLTCVASETGLDDESIDLVFCIDVLSDITEISSTLHEMHRILKPDGILSVFEPHTGFEPGAWKPERSIKELTHSSLFCLHERDNRILKFKKITEV